MADSHSGGFTKSAVRILRWVILLPIALGILLFVIDNRQIVDLEIPLTGIAIQAPLFLVLLLVFLLGLGLGGLLTWLSSLKYRRQARRERREREHLLRDIDAVAHKGGHVEPAEEKSPYLPPD